MTRGCVYVDYILHSVNGKIAVVLVRVRGQGWKLLPSVFMLYAPVRITVLEDILSREMHMRDQASTNLAFLALIVIWVVAL